MIQAIFGKKGSGKTKRIIDMANERVKVAEGDVLFIDDDNRYMFDLKHRIRFINASEYEIPDAHAFFGFLNGIAAMNFDLDTIFVDGFLRIVSADVHELEEFFQNLAKMSESKKINFAISVSADLQDVPESIRVYAV